MTIVELSHIVREGERVYPHLPPARLFDVVSREDSRQHYAPGVTFHIGGVDMCGNIGTWVDAPFHRWEDGVDVAGLALDRLVDLDIVVVDARELRAVGPKDLGNLDDLELAGRAVLVHTGRDTAWQTSAYLQDAPFLTADAAQRLVDAGAAFVGIDSANVDDTSDGERPVHSILLRSGIPIAENMTGLGGLPARGARLHAAPVKMRGMGTFPVRAYALVP